MNKQIGEQLMMQAVNGFLFGLGFILAAVLFKALLHVGICG